ncbi:MAG: hypothetical protein K9L21_05105 [Spirochaetia bacterium]|nr:hypothetical protein [Spirochaetia bacterium]
MDLREFMERVQAYYGPYSNGQGPEIVKYLKPFTDAYEDYLDKLFDHVLRNYSSRWKMPPDIAIFEESKDFVKGSMPTRKQLNPPPEEREFLSKEETAKEWERVLKSLGGKRA